MRRASGDVFALANLSPRMSAVDIARERLGGTITARTPELSGGNGPIVGSKCHGYVLRAHERRPRAVTSLPGLPRIHMFQGITIFIIVIILFVLLRVPQF